MLKVIFSLLCNIGWECTLHSHLPDSYSRYKGHPREHPVLLGKTCRQQSSRLHTRKDISEINKKLTLKTFLCIYWLDINVILIYTQINCLFTFRVLQFFDINQCNETIFHMSCRCIDAYYSFKTLSIEFILQKIQLKTNCN